MNDFILDTPVAFFFFNKEDTTLRVFERICEARPRQLYLISDGARTSVEGEEERVSCLRRKIMSQINWECSVKTDYAETNMGCKNRMASGITWVFEHEERAIIIEDDCLPSKGFFEFCQIMLEKYKDDDSIMMVSGSNTLHEFQMLSDYTFSFFSVIWGWATWRRAWSKYDIGISNWKNKKNSQKLKHMFSPLAYMFLANNWNQVCYHNMDTWDYQWEYCRISNNGLGIVPQNNMIENIGFGHENATHTTGNALYDFTMKDMNFPMTMRENVIRDIEYDRLYQKKYLGFSKLFNSLKNRWKVLMDHWRGV